MRKFSYVTGELTEVQRYINVPMRWREQYPSRERRELWIAADRGNDVKLTVHSRVMPARRGHRVNVLMLADLVVGLANLTTGRQVNFVQMDPPLLVRGGDGLAALGILGVGLAAAAAWDARSLLFAVPAALLFVPLFALWRFLMRGRLRMQVDSWLATVNVPACCGGGPSKSQMSIAFPAVLSDGCRQFEKCFACVPLAPVDRPMNTRSHDFATVDMHGPKAALVACGRDQRLSVSVLVRDAVARDLGVPDVAERHHKAGSGCVTSSAANRSARHSKMPSNSRQARAQRACRVVPTQLGRLPMLRRC